MLEVASCRDVLPAAATPAYTRKRFSWRKAVEQAAAAAPGPRAGSGAVAVEEPREEMTLDLMLGAPSRCSLHVDEEGRPAAHTHARLR